MMYSIHENLSCFVVLYTGKPELVQHTTNQLGFTKVPRLEDGLEAQKTPTASWEVPRGVVRLRKKEATYMVGDASKPGQGTEMGLQTGGQTTGWRKIRPPASKLDKC